MSVQTTWNKLMPEIYLVSYYTAEPHDEQPLCRLYKSDYINSRRHTVQIEAVCTPVNFSSLNFTFIFQETTYSPSSAGKSSMKDNSWKLSHGAQNETGILPNRHTVMAYHLPHPVDHLRCWKTNLNPNTSSPSNSTQIKAGYDKSICAFLW